MQVETANDECCMSGVLQWETWRALFATALGEACNGTWMARGDVVLDRVVVG